MGEMIKRGDEVIWPAGNELMKGRVVDTYKHLAENALANTNNFQLQSSNALLIELEDGSKVLKLEREVIRGS